jgi:hypothetical protein
MYRGSSRYVSIFCEFDNILSTHAVGEKDDATDVIGGVTVGGDSGKDLIDGGGDQDGGIKDEGD